MPPSVERARAEQAPTADAALAASPSGGASPSGVAGPAWRDLPTMAARSPNVPIVRQWQFWGVVALVVFVVVGGLILEQGKTAVATAGSSPTTPATTRSPVVSTTTSSAPTTTTTVAIPPAPQPSAEIAANALISSWAEGNRPVALSVATTQAVDVLFAVSYPGGLATDRGCSVAAIVVCTYGPPGGASPNDPIYSLRVEQAPGGWYVDSAQILG
ncbi:MAG TPA: hypothetical protein VED63_05950 [Acidimicrobiales bacterium]|nr:hypothetical protein [Acidimicrobiales bacterium]